MLFYFFKVKSIFALNHYTNLKMLKLEDEDTLAISSPNLNVV